MVQVCGVVRPRDGDELDLDGGGNSLVETEVLASGRTATAGRTIFEDFVVEETAGQGLLLVLIGLLDQGPVVPVRPGTVGNGGDRVRAEVEVAARAELVQRLEALDGLVGLGVNADDDESESDAIAAAAGAASQPTIKALDRGLRIPVGEQVASLPVAHWQGLADAILHQLRRWPCAIRRAP